MTRAAKSGDQPVRYPSQIVEGRGSREWAEEQIRLCGRTRRPISLRRINALLDANGFPLVAS